MYGEAVTEADTLCVRVIEQTDKCSHQDGPYKTFAWGGLGDDPT